MWLTLIYLMGLVGNLGFGAACVPMAWKAYRAGRNTGIPVSSIWMFLIALTNFYGYLILHYGAGNDPLVSVIGLTEIVSWLTVWRYHYFPRKDFRDEGWFVKGVTGPTGPTGPTGWRPCRCSEDTGSLACPIHHSGDDYIEQRLP